MRRITSLGISALGATLALALSQSATAQGPAPQDSVVSSVIADTTYMTVRQGAEWTYFDYKDSISNSVRRVHAGTKNGDVCSFSGSRTIDGDAGVVSVEREIATNLKTCVMVTEVGEIQASDMDLPESTEVTEASATSGAETRPDGVLASTSAWHRTRYVDPPGITVNRATTNVHWTYFGGCVTSSSGHTTDYYWAAATGWLKTSSTTTNKRTCAAATTTSSSFFANGSFCVGQPTTYTYFAPNIVNGLASGARSVDWNTSKSGGCNTWLSFQSHSGTG